MQASRLFHELIEEYNPLMTPTLSIERYLKRHPVLYKTALVVNHVFRAASMTAFMLFLPISLPASLAICFGGSLFYRLTVENNCAYKFALPAFGGAVSFLLLKTVLTAGPVFASLASFGVATAAILPLAAYGAYVVLTVDRDVDAKISPWH